MTEKDFDKLIGGKLRDHSQEPPQELFSRIEKSLAEDVYTVPVAQKRRSLTKALRYAGIAAMLCALLGTALYLGNRYAEVQQLPVAENAPANTETATNADDASPYTAPQTTNEPLLRRIRERIEPVARNVTRTQSSASDPMVETATESYTEQEGTESSSLQEEENTTDGRRKPYRHYNDPRNVGRDNSYRDMTAMEWNGTEERHRSRTKTSLGFYAGNLGAGRGDMRTNDPDRVVSNGMLIQQRVDNQPVTLSGLKGDDGRPVLAPFEPSVKNMELNHRMPLNVGVGISIPLSEQVSLNTGLSYSYLYSASSQSFSSGSGQITRELHYLGIPLGVSYTFFSKKGFSLYAYGGGALEKAILCHETYRFANTIDSGKESSTRSVKGVQMSVNASAGVSYNFNRSIAVYLEPGVSYYFAQSDQPANYRTVHPTSFSLKLGLRFGL